MRHRPLHLPLRVRAMLAFGMVSLVLAGSLAGVTFVLVRAWVVDDREEAAVRQAYSNARAVRTRLRAGEADIPALLAGLQVTGTGDALFQQSGSWYASGLGVDRSALPPSLRQAVDEGDAARQLVVGREGPVLAIGVPVPELGGQYFELVGLEDTDATLRTLATALTVGALVAAGIGALTGAAVSGRVLRPVRRASEVAAEIRDGRTDARLRPTGDPDLDPLVDSFNGMVDELEARARREARFASDVSHDLRGPLTALSAAVSVVNRRRDQLPPEASAAVDALEAQVTSFNRLVLDLLEISRFEAGTAELEARPLVVESFVKAVLAERRDDVAVVVPDGYDPVVAGDPRRLRQALANVLENAERYAGGARRVAVEPVDGQVVRIVVEDDGPGVAPDERRAIFDRYERGRARRDPSMPGGSGLGLALAAQQVQLHHGAIRVTDAPSGGARFEIDLPEADR